MESSESENSPTSPPAERGEEEHETKPEVKDPNREPEAGGEMVRKQLILAVEGTAAVGPYWQTIFSDYLEKIVRSFCGNNPTGEKQSKDLPELSLVMFNSHGSYSACLVQRSGWTTNVELFFQWLLALPFGGGGFNDAAIAEGLAEVLMMFSGPQGSKNQNGDVQRHCVLIAASNPYPLPTPVYRPQIQNLDKSDNNAETQPDNRLYDAETLAKFFPQCAVSLSVICPKKLPKLTGIYNAGKHNPRAADPVVDNVKNPHFLVLISENFMEARASLGRSGVANLPPSNQSAVKADAIPIPSICGPSPAVIPPANGSTLVLPPVSVGPVPPTIIPPATVKVEPTTLASVAGPTFPHIPSVPRAPPQPPPILQVSSPSTSQDMNPGNETSAADTKPTAPSSLRQPGSAAARILNDVARQALSGGAMAVPPSMAVPPILSNMISSGMSSSNPSSQAVITSTVPANVPVNNPIVGISQPMTNILGSSAMEQGNVVPGVSQMVHNGMSMNQNVMNGVGSGGSMMPPNPGMSQQGQHGMQNVNNLMANMPPSQQPPGVLQSAQSKYIKVWEGSLSGQRQGQPVFIARLEGYRNASASESLAANWPQNMQIVRLISQDHMNNKQYAGKADFLVFRAMNQHGFLVQLQEKKLCAVIQLPSQTLLLSVSDKAHRLIGMLFPGDMVVFKPQPNQQLQAQLQQQQQQHQPQMPQNLQPMQQQQNQMPQILQQQQMQQQQNQMPQIPQQQNQQQQPPHQQQMMVGPGTSSQQSAGYMHGRPPQLGQASSQTTSNMSGGGVSGGGGFMG